MLVRLLDFNYNIQYVPRVKNLVADFFSRMPLHLQSGKDTDIDTFTVDNVLADLPGITIEEWEQAQVQDDIVIIVSEYIKNGGPKKTPFRNVKPGEAGKKGKEIIPERKECKFDWLMDWKESYLNELGHNSNDQSIINNQSEVREVMPSKKTSRYYGRLVKKPREDVLRCSCTVTSEFLRL
ncbi:hypothetical protein NDU88_006319, partial [Pleurodeles waltl]